MSGEKSLAGHYEEFLTALARFGSNPGAVEEVERFRGKMVGMLDSARAASQRKYSPSEVDMADLVASALLDETVFKSARRIPKLQTWAPVHPVRFPPLGQLAGEQVFRNVDSMLDRPETLELSDILEFHYLCLLLGFEGAFGMNDLQPQYKLRRGSLEEYRRAIYSALERMRKRAPDAVHASEASPHRANTGQKGSAVLIAAAVISIAVVTALVTWFRLSLEAAITSLGR